jgi:hypothetical protein
MDESRLKKMIQSALDISYSGVTIRDFKMLETNKPDETGKWVHDSYALFMDLNRVSVDREDYLEMSNERNVERFLESMFGFEFSVNFL